MRCPEELANVLIQDGSAVPVFNANGDISAVSTRYFVMYASLEDRFIAGG